MFFVLFFFLENDQFQLYIAYFWEAVTFFSFVKCLQTIHHWKDKYVNFLVLNQKIIQSLCKSQLF